MAVNAWSEGALKKVPFGPHASQEDLNQAFKQHAEHLVHVDPDLHQDLDLLKMLMSFEASRLLTNLNNFKDIEGFISTSCLTVPYATYLSMLRKAIDQAHKAMSEAEGPPGPPQGPSSSSGSSTAAGPSVEPNKPQKRASGQDDPSAPPSKKGRGGRA